jgi:hypothetical protein
MAVNSVPRRVYASNPLVLTHPGYLAAPAF